MCFPTPLAHRYYLGILSKPSYSADLIWHRENAASCRLMLRHKKMVCLPWPDRPSKNLPTFFFFFSISKRKKKTLPTNTHHCLIFFLLVFLVLEKRRLSYMFFISLSQNTPRCGLHCMRHTFYVVPLQRKEFAFDHCWKWQRLVCLACIFCCNSGEIR